nr:family 78 glycoside hydrolase catalytic domain [uncultured Alistipes sp.]
MAFLLAAVSAGAAAARDARPLGLTCNYAEEPLGMGDRRPSLGWRIDTGRPGYLQGAYRVLVASDRKLLEADRGDVWDSGVVREGRSQHVKFGGVPLLPCCDYYWKVKVWDTDGAESDWSPVASWRTGLFDEFDWKGEWVSSRFAEVLPHRRYKSNRRTERENWFMEDSAAVYMRRQVELPSPVRRATAFICGLGYYELYINGRKVGDRVLDPLFTDYDKRVVYAAYDVTDRLAAGSNAVGIVLGNGWYSSPTRDVFGMHDVNWRTPPKVRLNIVVEYESGAREVIATDRTWRWGHGEIVYNSVRSGETIDHTRTVHGWNEVGFRDSLWRPVCRVPAPLGRLTADPMPPMRVTGELPAERVVQTSPGVYLVDFGENLTGWVEARVRGERGQTVELQFNEVLKADGSLDTQNSTWHTRGRYQTGLLILGGEGMETFEPRFTYHGFRYMQVRGLTYEPSPEDFTAKCVHTDLPSAGTFHCSMPKLNELNAAVRRTLLNSIHGIPGEEPTREKMGWTLDAAVVMESYLYNFDALNAYKKALRDFRDAQAPTGHIPSTVPSAGWGYVHEDGSLDYWDDPWWGGSIFLLTDKLYLHTGDVGVLEYAFPALKAYVDFLTSTARDHIVTWSLGDWLDLNPDTTSQASNLTPVAQTSTAGYYWMSRRLAEYAEILGYDRRLSEHYGALAERIRERLVQPGVPRSPDRHLCGEFADGAGAAAGSRARARHAEGEGRAAAARCDRPAGRAYQRRIHRWQFHDGLPAPQRPLRRGLPDADPAGKPRVAPHGAERTEHDVRIHQPERTRKRPSSLRRLYRFLALQVPRRNPSRRGEAGLPGVRHRAGAGFGARGGQRRMPVALRGDRLGMETA